MPVLHAGLAQLPTEENGLVAFRMPGGKVDQAAVEVFHLDAQGLELADGGGDLPGSVRNLLLQLSHPFRIEPAAVAGHPGLDAFEARARVDEPAARPHEGLGQRADDRQRRVGLVLGEELHPRME